MGEIWGDARQTKQRGQRLGVISCNLVQSRVISPSHAKGTASRSVKAVARLLALTATCRALTLDEQQQQREGGGALRLRVAPRQQVQPERLGA